jgi:hypothetical protein
METVQVKTNTLGEAILCEDIALPTSILSMPIDKICGH